LFLILSEKFAQRSGKKKKLFLINPHLSASATWGPYGENSAVKILLWRAPQDKLNETYHSMPVRI
jgi:hypothetical protein